MKTLPVRLTITIFSIVLLTMSNQAFADWKPSGPITLLIGFGAGGGTDTQARSLATEIEAAKGWRIIPKNMPGAGGAVMAAYMKKKPADGLTLGLAITSTYAFASIGNDQLALDDFTYITTTCGSQTGVVARTDSGWKTMQDVVNAGKNGEKIVWANYSDKTQLASEVIAKHLGLNVNHVRVKGGKACINSLVAQDANLAWTGGAHRGLVSAGELTILVSALDEPLVQKPDGQTLKDIGLPYAFGAEFILAAPAGIPSEAREALAAAVAEIITSKDSKTAKYIAKQYPPQALVIAGEDLDRVMETKFNVHKQLLSEFTK